MTILAILLCIATCTVATEAATTNNTTANKDNVCSSTECLNIASELSQIMDPTINPCEDFYEFSCGGFLKSEPVDINRRYQEILKDNIFADLKQVIRDDIEPNEPKAFKLVKRLHKSCMNVAAIEAKGVEPLRKYLRDLGGWPVVEGDSWNGQNFDWRHTIYKFRRDGQGDLYWIGDAIGHLVRFGVERVERHPLKRIMTLKYPYSLLLRKAKEEDFDRKESFLRTYYDSMVRIAQLLGADYNRTMAELRETLSFEIKLTQMKLPMLQIINLPEYNPFTIAELNEKYPSVPWMMYIRKYVPSSIRVDDSEIIHIPDPNYYVKLEALMANTSKRVQANYAMSRIALRNAVLSTEEMRTTVYRILAARFNITVKQDRLNYCATEVIHHLWQSVTAMYANKFMNKETTDAVNAIVANLKWQLDEKLKSFTWPNETVKWSALDKAARLITHIGYPDKVLDKLELKKLHGNLEFTEDDYFGNMDSLSNYDHNLGMKELEASSPEINEWTNLRGPHDMRSFYNTLKNSIQIAAMHLRGRFFSKSGPKFMNYGALGGYIGHEMSHAFFENGVYQGTDGKIAQYSGIARMPNFNRSAQCLIDHYESYHVDSNGLKLDGRKTQSEDLADLSGMILAYDAYEKWTVGKPEEPKLRGLEQYSAKQMFWISSAAIACEKIKPEMIPFEIRNKVHTISKFRIIGMLSNMPEFAKDFNCNATTLMNPAERCDIWQG